MSLTSTEPRAAQPRPEPPPALGADLHAAIAEHAASTEIDGRVHDEVIAGLREAGMFSLLVPARHGGPGVDFADALRAIAAVAAVDGSTGWVVGQNCLSSLIFGCLPEPAQAMLYANGPDVIGAGAIAPKGRARKRGESYRVSGRWPYVSGSPHAEWFYANAVEVDGGKLVMVGGMPSTRVFLVPRAEVVIDETWEVFGLAGTASHDMEIDAVLDPARSFTVDPNDDRDSGAMQSIARGGLIIAASAVGIARGALGDIWDSALGGHRGTFAASPLAASPTFHQQIGSAEMTLAAAEALLFSAADDTPRAGDAGRIDRARYRAVTARVVSLAKEVVDQAFAEGGSAAVYQRSSLQRRVRDIAAASQHYAARASFYEILGALRVGAEVAGPV